MKHHSASIFSPISFGNEFCDGIGNGIGVRILSGMSYAGHVAPDSLTTLPPLVANENLAPSMSTEASPSAPHVDFLQMARQLTPMSHCLDDLWPSED